MSRVGGGFPWGGVREIWLVEPHLRSFLDDRFENGGIGSMHTLEASAPTPLRAGFARSAVKA
ncbi:MAG: hypothetical protein ACREFX_02950 [Opitutaceae bacterium]